MSDHQHSIARETDHLEQLDLEVKFVTGEAGLVAGYASLFGKPADTVRDVIAPGAFAASIARRLPEMLREHKGDPIGTWTDVTEDDLGLRVTGRFDLSTQAGRVAHADVLAGRMDGLSIGYFAKKSDRAGDGVRTLREVDLAEISIVRRPASSRARILSVKSMEPSTMTDNPTATPEAEDEVKALGDRLAAIEAKAAAIETKSADAAKITRRLDEIEKRLARPAIGTKSAGDTEEVEVKAAFADYLRTGRASAEVKALTIESPGTGGVIAPPQVSTSIIQKIAEFSPVRQLASSIGLSAPLVQIPRLVDEVEVGEVTETSTRPEGELSFEQIDLKPHEMAVIVPMSKTVVEDAAVDLVSFVSNHVARRFGIKEAGWFVKGNGTSQAEGILTSPEVGVTDSAVSGGVVADDLVEIYYGIKSVYATRGSWLMNRKTMASIRKLKDETGVYLWQPALAAGQPPTLLGRPVYEAPDMPDPVAGATPIAFGDIASGYLIADRIALEIARDDLTGWGTGLVKILARRRVGGRVVLGEAISKLKIKA
ncbi:phage major capsid protein [Pinisolibacter sp.]|uniref:phage major capsid protein n=1 Tax=Pinisolibacter sp. TaxID=2172024 RepID=UPI002FDE4D80